MQSLLTASVVLVPAAYALLVTVQFILGIFTLWKRSHTATVPSIEPEVPTLITQAVELEIKLKVITLPTAEAEILATFAPELIQPPTVLAPLPIPAPIPALEVLTIRELKKMASSVGVKNYSSMTKSQLVEKIRAKELVTA